MPYAPAMTKHIFLSVILLAADVLPAHGQKPLRELVTYPPEKTSPAPAYLHSVIAPTASSLVVNDALGMMLICHRPPNTKDVIKPNTVWPQLTYAKLDASGVPGPFKALTLPKPASLAKQASYPLALAFHPKLPLLYIWQDIEAIAPRAEATDAPVYKDFDHVLIYHLDGAEPELLMSFGRGPRFAFGLGFAAMTLDPAASRLFVGNVQHPAPKDQINGAVGYFRLATDGLPEFDSEPRTPAPDRAGRIAAAKVLATKTPKDGGLKKISTPNYGLLWAYPCGLGMYAPSADVLVFGGPNGPIVWEHGNSRAELQADYIPPYYRPANIGHLDRMVVHPTLPVLYGSITAPDTATWTDSYLWRTEHSDGFPTLLPQRMYLYYFLASTPPIVLPKHNRIAIGGRKRIAFITLDGEGRLTKERTEVEVNSTRVTGLAYSIRFDKLYLAADDPPPPPKDPKIKDPKK
jgi:hypothetical protein